MDKNILNALETLIVTAEDVGRTLLLDERINLIAYDEKGNISSNHTYGYDGESIKNLSERLDKIASKQRARWTPNFKQFLPALDSLGFTMEFCASHVKVGAKLYRYNNTGVRTMADDISDALLELHAGEFGDRIPINKANYPNNITEGDDHGDIECKHDCDNCKNKFCSKNPNLVHLLWHTLTEKQQETFLSNLSPEAKTQLTAALNLTPNQ